MFSAWISSFAFLASLVICVGLTAWRQEKGIYKELSQKVFQGRIACKLTTEEVFVLVEVLDQHCHSAAGLEILETWKTLSTRALIDKLQLLAVHVTPASMLKCSRLGFTCEKLGVWGITWTYPVSVVFLVAGGIFKLLAVTLSVFFLSQLGIQYFQGDGIKAEDHAAFSTTTAAALLLAFLTKGTYGNADVNMGSIAVAGLFTAAMSLGAVNRQMIVDILPLLKDLPEPILKDLPGKLNIFAPIASGCVSVAAFLQSWLVWYIQKHLQSPTDAGFNGRWSWCGPGGIVFSSVALLAYILTMFIGLLFDKDTLPGRFTATCLLIPYDLLVTCVLLGPAYLYIRSLFGFAFMYYRWSRLKDADFLVAAEVTERASTHGNDAAGAAGGERTAIELARQGAPEDATANV